MDNAAQNTEQNTAAQKTAPVLVVGGTGFLGSKVVAELLARGKSVRALVRPRSDATTLEQAGAHVARGDMMDPRSLAAAMDGVDAVVTSAAGYTRHRKGDTPVTDTVGNANLIGAAHAAGARRFVLTSILTCDQTPDVPHFWHKKLAEDRLEVPFVALRIGWDRPVSMRDVADIAGGLLGRRIRVRTIPLGLLHALGALPTPAKTAIRDLTAMLDWFQTGGYVADTARQREVFGSVPRAEDAIARMLSALGHTQVSKPTS